MRRASAADPTPLEEVRTAVTLRDRLHEVPVDALVPDGWRVGVEVVSFPDEPPADAATFAHPAHARDLLLTDAGTDGTNLVVYERDREFGRRVAVASVPGRAADRETVRAGLAAAARHASRIESGRAGGPGGPAGDAAPRLRARVRDVLRRLSLY